MLKEIMGLPREYRNRVKRDEVVDRLSFGVWKTCNRILEEVEAQRAVEGKEPPASRDEAIWFHPKLDTRMHLTHLFLRGVVEKKTEDELTDRDKAWALKSDSNADEKEVRFRAEHGFGNLTFYKLVRGGVRKKDEDKEVVGALESVWVRG